MQGSKIFLTLLALMALHAAPRLAFADEPNPAATPAPEETVPAPADFLVDRPDYQPGHPFYLSIPSKWAFGLRFSIHDIPVSGALGDTFQFYAERMFPFIGWGYLAGGVHIGTFPLYQPSAQVPYPDYANAIAGLQLKYQIKFSQDAFIVPVIGLEWEFYTLKENEFNDNLLKGYDLGASLGIMINAGFIDRATERDASQSIGLTRAYLTMEVRTSNINNNLFSLSGNYWLWGLRMELK